MDFQAVGSPTNYGAPNVFQQQGGGQQGVQGQGQSQQIQAALAKAKSLLSSGQISPDQYNSLTNELSTMGGNMGAGMPGSASTLPAGAPLDISAAGVGG